MLLLCFKLAQYILTQEDSFCSDSGGKRSIGTWEACQSAVAPEQSDAIVGMSCKLSARCPTSSAVP